MAEGKISDVSSGHVTVNSFVWTNPNEMKSCPCGTGPQTSNHILPYLRHFETPDIARSDECPQEALETGWDTVADCGLLLTHKTEDAACPGTQKKKDEKLLAALSPTQQTQDKKREILRELVSSGICYRAG